VPPALFPRRTPRHVGECACLVWLLATVLPAIGACPVLGAHRCRWRTCHCRCVCADPVWCFVVPHISYQRLSLTRRCQALHTSPPSLRPHPVACGLCGPLCLQQPAPSCFSSQPSRRCCLAHRHGRGPSQPRLSFHERASYISISDTNVYYKFVM